MRRLLPLLALPPLALPLAAQGQSTFYAAYEDGRELERRGDFRGALVAYQRAATLRPASAPLVLIYGNNVLRDYFPYTRAARCHVELGELDAAEAQLARALAQHEPAREREELSRRVRELRAARAPKETPKPEAPMELPRPAERPHAETSRPEPLPSPEAAPTVPAPKAEPPPVSSSPAPASKAPAIPSLPRPTEPAPAPVANPAAASIPPRPAPRPWWPWALMLLPAVTLLWRRRRAPASGGDFSEPERLGPYRIERLLGRGGFASTYLARHETSGQRVALKRLHPYRIEDPEFLGRFRQEAQLGSRLNHPNLVRLVDPGPAEGLPWIAMEYVEGQRLDERIKKGELHLHEALSIALGIAKGLAYAHAQGVVHRDLKPTNIMLDASGVRIMDFGIARVMDAETLTTTYAFLGTPRYAAPEAQLKTTVGPASDRYSLGMILFELLAGHPPFDGETPFELLDQHRRAPLPDLAALRPELPPELVRLVARLGEKEADERPEDSEVVRRLEALLGEPATG